MKNKFIFAALLLTSLAILPQCSGKKCCTHEHDREPVRNIIYMIGDGMGVAQVGALIFNREPEKINMERATAVGLVKTPSANNRVTDSAAAGTALATGRKTNNSMLGLAPDGSRLESVMAKAGAEGYETGVVVSTIVPHATPGAFYGHVHNRSSYDSIAVQLLESGMEVFVGGGSKYFNRREDGRDLVEEFRNEGYSMVFDLEGLEGLGSGKVGALVREGDFEYALEGRGDYLPRATAKAIEILDNNTRGGKGFFLMVEGSQIDYAGHGNDAENVKGEMLDFDRCVGIAFDYADRNPGTLVVVLADHETGGLSIPSVKSDFTLPESGIEYKFSTGGHSATMIPMFAYGTGAHHFTGVFDNTEIPLIMEKLLLGEK